MKRPIVFSRQTISVESLRALRSSIRLDPHYQRQGDVWPTGKQQLFIDSLLNGFIIPPMYWHSLSPSSEYFDGRARYAVVDGRQRLETLFRYLDDDLGLSPDNAILGDNSVSLGGLTIGLLRERYPWLYGDLMRSPLEVVMIETEDVDLIEELFSRLNEGVPLKAAEKRNRGRVLAPRVQAFVANQHFFTTCLPFGNQRYRHYDLLAKFMRIEDRDLRDRVPDLKKLDLDRLFDRLRALERPNDDAKAIAAVEDLLDRVRRRLSALEAVFTTKDPRLGSVGMVTVYYAFVKLIEENQLAALTGADVTRFEQLRQSVKRKDYSDLTEDEQRMVDFASFSQGPTTGSYLTARLEIMAKVLRDWTTSIA